MNIETFVEDTLHIIIAKECDDVLEQREQELRKAMALLPEIDVEE